MSALTPEQAQQLLTDVSFRDKLTAARMVMPSGLHREDICSMEEAHWFLEPSLQTLPAVNLDKLADWLEQHYQERETATSIRRIVQESPNQVEAYKQTYELIGARLTQAREVVNA